MLDREDMMLTAIWILHLLTMSFLFPSESALPHTSGGHTHYSPCPLSLICSLEGSVVKEGLARKHHSFSSQTLLSGLTASQEPSHSAPDGGGGATCPSVLGHCHLLRQGCSGATGRGRAQRLLGASEPLPKGKRVSWSK